jgi:hypothetical protein
LTKKIEFKIPFRHCKLKYSRKVVQIIDSKARKTREKTRQLAQFIEIQNEEKLESSNKRGGLSNVTRS